MRKAAQLPTAALALVALLAWVLLALSPVAHIVIDDRTPPLGYCTNGLSGGTRCEAPTPVNGDR